MPEYHLAQINIAQMKAPLHHPSMKSFLDQIAEINDLAEASPGFVWRLRDQYGDATSIRPFGSTILVNMSVWESPEHLMDYAYKSAHKEVMQNRKEWFDPMEEAHLAMWWVPADSEPTIEEAKAKLEYLFAHGESERAFTFRNVFPKPTS
jgi:hypothetical protein